MIVRESQIEDVLATYPDIAKEILGIKEELTLLARQKILPSGEKIDLLFVADSRIKLVELKVEKCKPEFIHQVKSYRDELIKLQTANKFIAGDIDAFLAAPEFSGEQEKACQEFGIVPCEYEPQKVLEAFFARLKKFANFITLKPADHGLWQLHLLNRLLYALSEEKVKKELAEETGLSVSTIGSYLRLAGDLHLIETAKNKKYRLTDLGKKYVWSKDIKAPVEFISDEQSRTLQDFIIKDPFISRTVFGIYTMVETVFTLSKNTYPVPLDMVMNYFRESSGKHFEWSTRKTTLDGTKMYSNYATELGLIGRIGDKFYITPDGVKFILLLQLHKSIKVVDALGISR
jgi:predicted transcriptional regulator